MRSYYLGVLNDEFIVRGLLGEVNVMRYRLVFVLGSLSLVLLSLFLMTAANSQPPRVTAQQHPVKTLDQPLQPSGSRASCPTLSNVMLTLGGYQPTGSHHIGYIAVTANRKSPARKYVESVQVMDDKGHSSTFEVDIDTGSSTSVKSELEDADQSWWTGTSVPKYSVQSC
jgi:hypothetical protein